VDPLDHRLPRRRHGAQQIVALHHGRGAHKHAMLPACSRLKKHTFLERSCPRDYLLQAPLMRCSSCGSENREGRKFCAACGAALTLACAGCGGINQPGERFCGDCGRNLADSPKAPAQRDPRNYTPPHLADRILAERAALEARSAADGERRTITALFADIKGSVEVIEGLDPDEARSTIDPALQIMIHAIHRYEGYVAQSRGDGILALFGAPIAPEDHPSARSMLRW